MDTNSWFLAIGLLLVGVTLIIPLLERVRIPSTWVYLAIGLLLGGGGLGIISWDLVRQAHLFERLTEIAVIVSLFTVGLNIRRSPGDRSWLVPVRLATVTMVLTIAMIAAVGVVALGLPLGAAVLLGAVLAPTDPVLATDVQLHGARDRDLLRHGLSGEAGLNDGTAFPFVMLGLGLLALHPAPDSGLAGLWREPPFTLVGWLGWDLVWAVSAGFMVGGAIGWLVGHGALALQRMPGSTIGLHEFLVLGLVALTYGAAELIDGYGFLAVFAAGYTLRFIELRAAGDAPEPAELPPMVRGDPEQPGATIEDRKVAAQFLAASLVDFNAKLEQVLTAAVMVLVGGVLTTEHWSPEVLWLAPLLFLVIRPVTVALGLAGSGTRPVPLGLMGWFGVRGVGSIYYLTYAIEKDMAAPLAQQLTGIVLSLIVVSVLIHGATVVPLMGWYERHAAQRRSSSATRGP